jgi:hypothetical protein
VIDLEDKTGTPIKQTVSTCGTTRLDEMALTNNGKILIAANNAEDPPFATLFNANGNSPHSNVTIISKITIDSSITPAGGSIDARWRSLTRRLRRCSRTCGFADHADPDRQWREKQGIPRRLSIFVMPWAAMGLQRQS